MPKFKVGDIAFMVDLPAHRVFPVIIKEAQNSRNYYKVELDVTPGVHDALSYNGYAKPWPFQVPSDQWIDPYNTLFDTKSKAYQYMLQQLNQKEEELKNELDGLPYYIKLVEERLSDAMKAEGSVYRAGDIVWVTGGDSGNSAEVEECTVVGYDHGDLQRRPYQVKEIKWDHKFWCSVDNIFDSKEKAIKTLQERLRAQCEETCAKLESDD